jgi:cyclopropane-fatty-acyl-phospholipid synthase
LFAAYRGRPDFIQLEVFPGGMLPTEPHLVRGAMDVGLSLVPGSIQRFGDSYARTLALWLERFDEAWPRIASRTFDERFRRLWRYYLAYCAAGFLTGRTNVVQMAFTRS